MQLFTKEFDQNQCKDKIKNNVDPWTIHVFWKKNSLNITFKKYAFYEDVENETDMKKILKPIRIL